MLNAAVVAMTIQQSFGAETDQETQLVINLVQDQIKVAFHIFLGYVQLLLLRRL